MLQFASQNPALRQLGILAIGGFNALVVVPKIKRFHSSLYSQNPVATHFVSKYADSHSCSATLTSRSMVRMRVASILNCLENKPPRLSITFWLSVRVNLIETTGTRIQGSTRSSATSISLEETSPARTEQEDSLYMMKANKQ